MKTLSADEALSMGVARHGLGKRGTGIADLTDVVVGLHSTNPTTPHLSLRARLDGFARGDLHDAMYESWQLVRFRAMRLTMFVMSHELLEIAAGATRHLVEANASRWLRDSQFTAEEFDRLAVAIERALSGGALTVRELREELRLGAEVDVSGIVGRMCDQGRLVGGAPWQSWRSAIRRYHRWHEALPDVDLGRWSEKDAIRELALRYVRGYGPVTLSDVSWWTGIAKGKCRDALDDLEARMDQVEVTGWPGPLFVAPGSVCGELPEGVEALPLLDPYVQGYRERCRFLEPGRERFVYDGGGNAAATLVRRGRIIGVWQMVKRREVRYHLFEQQPRSVRAAAEAELSAAGTFACERPVEVVRVAEMTPLEADGGRSASHPLDGQVHRASRRLRA